MFEMTIMSVRTKTVGFKMTRYSMHVPISVCLLYGLPFLRNDFSNYRPIS